MRKITFVVAVLGASCVSSIPTNGYAWGDEGHKTVCQIAFVKVKPATRAAITRLVQADGQFQTFSDACTWPDHPRKRAGEHFVNLTRDASGLTADCGVTSPCVVSAIAKDFAVLSSSTATDDEKAASLKFLGHWVGDVHQPLHVSFEDDRGGNQINVVGDCRGNLHGVWDGCLVLEAVGDNVQQAAAMLLTAVTPEQIQAWTQSTPREWANESFKIAESAQTKYCAMHGASCDKPDVSVGVDEAYISANVPIVKEQLQKAGIRLANLLDKALGD
jgi:nuclease S1